MSTNTGDTLAANLLDRYRYYWETGKLMLHCRDALILNIYPCKENQEVNALDFIDYCWVNVSSEFWWGTLARSFDLCICFKQRY